MTILTILQYPDPRLRRIGKPVEKIDERIKTIIADMFETNYATENCGALAATQLDLPDPPRITVIDLSEQKNQPLCLINPEIVSQEGEQYEVEGCMSVSPGFIYERVKRAAKIRVKALDREGQALDFIAEDYLAKCIQHELDHLNGKLYIDYLSSLKLNRIKNKIKKHTS